MALPKDPRLDAKREQQFPLAGVVQAREPAGNDATGLHQAVNPGLCCFPLGVSVQDGIALRLELVYLLSQRLDLAHRRHCRLGVGELSEYLRQVGPLPLQRGDRPVHRGKVCLARVIFA